MADLEKLLEKKQQLSNQIASIKAKQRKEEEKLNTRRKILIGSYFLKQYEGKMDDLIKLLDPFLTRDNDRILFNLQPKGAVGGKNETDTVKAEQK